MTHPLIVITGPTGVGKTDLSYDIAQLVSGAIVNADVGQLYENLSIGTAKPLDWASHAVPHYGFDVINNPQKILSAGAYRARAHTWVSEIRSRALTPVFVGGSGFYLESLVWKPCDNDISIDIQACVHNEIRDLDNQACWDLLYKKDPARAQAVHPNDRYRVERALLLCAAGILPSSQKPIYDPLEEPMLFIYVDRTKEDLESRIESRVDAMIQAGWGVEAYELDDAWRACACKRGIIGYEELLHDPFVQTRPYDRIITDDTRAALIIQTRQYAKRQRTYWRRFAERLRGTTRHEVVELCLTRTPSEVCIERLSTSIQTLKARYAR